MTKAHRRCIGLFAAVQEIVRIKQHACPHQFEIPFCKSLCYAFAGPCHFCADDIRSADRIHEARDIEILIPPDPCGVRTHYYMSLGCEYENVQNSLPLPHFADSLSSLYSCSSFANCFLVSRVKVPCWIQAKYDGSVLKT